MELADVTDSKSVGLIPRAGSTPATGINKESTDEIGTFYFFFEGVEKDARRSLRTVRWTVRASEGV